MAKFRSLCVAGVIALSGAMATAMQAQTVSRNFNSQPLKSVLHEIERQTKMSVIVNDINLNKRVTAKFNKTPLRDVLKQVLDESCEYEIADRIITIHPSRKAKQETQQQGKKKTQTVKGCIKDENGQPIVGASVTVVGQKNCATVTDIDGNFTLNAPEDARLHISYIGFNDKEIAANGKSFIDVMMDENSELLNEVVVVGYGTMKKKDLTGSLSAVKGSELAARRTTQLSTALQGSMPGVTVTRDNSAPGATAKIMVRGVTTIGDSNPLVIVDGTPGDINQVNPEDVESMTVLKDAASASIYGSRAAAGVILITTKRAKDGDLALNYNFEYGWEMPTKLPKYVGSQRYIEMVNETRYNDNPAGGKYQAYTEQQVNDWTRLNATDPDNYPMTDWQDILLKGSAPRMTHTIGIAGGTKNVKTKASFRYDKNDGLYVNKDYQRYMLRVNNDFHINKYIAANLDVTLSRSKTLSPTINPMGAAERKCPPIYAVRWQNGMWGDVKDGENLLAKLVDGGNITNWNNRIGAKAQIDVTPFDGLKLSAVVAPNFQNYKIKTFSRQIPYTRADDPTKIAGYMGGHRTTSLKEDRNDNHDITTQFFANYAKSIGRHDFSVMVGYEDYYAFWENMNASRDQYKLNNYPYLDLGSSDFRDNGGNAEEYAYRSVFGRLTYSYADRYLVQANFRRDGSSRFAPDSRWANFPSVSAGWVVSEEPFFKKAKMPWFSYLKLRASWGKLGNERILDANGNNAYYPYQANMVFGSALMQNGATVNSMATAAQLVYAVNNITWETTESWDIGLDANFFDNRLHFSADVYKKNTRDMLLELEIPKFVGFSNPSVNAGRMHTTGYDIELGWRDNIGEFNYSVSANLSDFVSKMGNLNGTQFLGEKVKMEGSQFDEWYGYLSDGLFQTQEDLDNSPKLNSNTKLGDIKYKDISGPDGVPDGKISPEYDRVKLGGSLPRYMFGISFNGSWRGFDFGLTFQGVGKQNSRISPAMIEGLADNWSNFPSLLEGNYWSSYNSDAQNAAAKYPRLTRTNRDGNMAMSDFWLFNGRYIRLKNLSLGYTLPRELTKKVKMDNVRFYISGNDLFSLSGFPKGWDPEVGTEGYPITTSLLFGVSVNF